MNKILETLRVTDYYVCTKEPNVLRYPRFDECKCFGPYESFINADKAALIIAENEHAAPAIIGISRFIPKKVAEYRISHKLCPTTTIHDAI